MTADARPDAATNASGRKGGRLSRREDIARIALDLFARNGFEGTSIRDIAEAAGLTKPALYYHFQDKEALYEHVLVERMSGLIEGAHDAIASTDDPVERIRLFLDRHAARMDREREAWMVSRQSFLSLVDSARRERVTGLRDEYEGLLRDLIAAAREAGRLDPETDPALVSRLLLSAVNDVPRWLRPGGGLTARDVAQSYAAITLKGLGAKG